MGGSIGFGGLGAVVGGGDIVYNYRTGETSGFAYGGVQGGWNGGASANFNAGFLRNLGDSNTNYSGPFTGASGSVGVPGLPISIGAFGAASSGGGSHPLTIDPNGVQSLGLTVGASLAGKYGGGLSETGYSRPMALGNFMQGTAPDSGFFDKVMFGLNQVCRK